MSILDLICCDSSCEQQRSCGLLGVQTREIHGQIHLENLVYPGGRFPAGLLRAFTRLI